MPEAIVEALEIVDIAHQDCGAFGLHKSLVPETVERFHHRPPIGDPGEWIGSREEFEPRIGVTEIRESTSITKLK